jgi:RNA polymerase sigma-70 factor (ECF subfamily)
MAEHFVHGGTTPSMAAARLELRGRVIEALDAMEPLDREVLVLRRFEEFNNADTAAILGISQNAASNRYTRALKRLGAILDMGATEA